MSHLFYDLDFTVSVFVVYARRVLPAHHKKLGRRLPLGGRIEIGENPEQAALREAREESGLEIKLIGESPPRELPGTTVLTAPSYLDGHDIAGDHRHIGLIYFARSGSDGLRLAAAERNDIRWCTTAELAAAEYDVPESIQFYAGEALERLAEDSP